MSGLVGSGAVVDRVVVGDATGDSISVGSSWTSILGASCATGLLLRSTGDADLSMASRGWDKVGNIGREEKT